MNNRMPLKFSDLTYNHVKKHLNIEDEFKDDDSFIEMCLLSAKDYIQGYTNLSIEQLDSISSVNVAVLLVASDFYSRRSAGYGYDDNKVNFMLKSILDLHREWL